MRTDSANPLTPSEVDKILAFLGYGNPSAPIWFMGLEEGIGEAGDEDYDHNLRERAKFEPIMDLFVAHLQLHEHGEPINLENRAKFTAVWIWMAKVCLARENGRIPENLAEVKEYVRKKLGRSNGETFLTELSPIPRKHAKREPGCPDFLGECSEEDAKSRAGQIRELLIERRPSIVICYGFGKAERFAKTLDVCWQGDKNPRVKKSSDSLYLLLPFFGNGQMSHEVLKDLLMRGLLDGLP